jgi:hypothetical protein
MRLTLLTVSSLSFVNQLPKLSQDFLDWVHLKTGFHLVLRMGGLDGNGKIMALRYVLKEGSIMAPHAQLFID